MNKGAGLSPGIIISKAFVLAKLKSISFPIIQNEYTKGFRECMDAVLQKINEVPESDAVRVTRCAACRMCEGAKFGSETRHTCTRTNTSVNADDYCSKAIHI